MSILSDGEIRRLCTEPTHIRYNNIGFKQFISGPFTKEEEILINYFNHVNAPNAPLIPVMDDQHFIRPITEKELADWKPMIAPYIPQSMKEVKYRDIGDEEHCYSTRKIISNGSSSYGYDVTLDSKVKLFTDVNATVVDPKRFNSDAYKTAKVHTDVDDAQYVLMPPHSFILGSTVEYLRIPRNVLTICLGKSTYARAGLILNVTPLEPEWEGNVVVEISNTTNLPAKVYINEGIGQFLFLEAGKVCDVSYADRGGKYQGQTGITPAKV